MANLMIFNRILVFTIVCLVLKTAQAQSITWQNTIGGDYDDQLFSADHTSDGGYILGGASSSPVSGDKTEGSMGGSDYWVVKLSITGTIEWQNTLGGSQQEYLRSIEQTSDGGYICGGWSESGVSGDKTEPNIGYADYWIVKLDASGNIQWQNTIGGDSQEDCRSVFQTADGGYLCAGTSSSDISGDKTENSVGGVDYWIVKLDGNGNIQWQQTLGGTANDNLTSATELPAGGYLCAGYSRSGMGGDKSEDEVGGADFWVVKLDASGNLVWDNTIGGTDDDDAWDIVATADGGSICVGNTLSDIGGDKTENRVGAFDAWIVKLNSSGNIVWQNNIGGTGGDSADRVEQTSDGGYIWVGTSHSDIGGDKTEANKGGGDYWVVKLNTTGDIEWQKTIGGSDHDYPTSVIEVSATEYFLGGISFSDISGDKTENSHGFQDYWVVDLSVPVGVDDIWINSMIQIYPNPGSGLFHVKFGKGMQIDGLELRDLTGRVVFQQRVEGTETEIDLRGENRGVYFLSVLGPAERYTRKVIFR